MATENFCQLHTGIASSSQCNILQAKKICVNINKNLYFHKSSINFSRLKKQIRKSKYKKIQAYNKSGKSNKNKAKEAYILAGDIGGTNARFALCKIKDNELITTYEHVFPTHNYKNFNLVLNAMLETSVKKEDEKPSIACFAVAGPIIKENYAKMTNLEWTIDGPELEKDFGFKILVINDFEALGYGVPYLNKEKDLVVLNDVNANEKGPIAVLGPGTGLGESQLIWDEGLNRYKVWPSEGGHANFAPRTPLQIELMQWIQEKYEMCEIEDVACGRGLERIYTFLTKNEENHIKAPEISKRALEEDDSTCIQAIDLMLSIIGSEAGHMALRSLSKGGVFLAGGMTSKLIERIKTGIVLESFLYHKNENFKNILKETRLSAVIEPYVGLIGAKYYAKAILEES